MITECFLGELSFYIVFGKPIYYPKINSLKKYSLFTQTQLFLNDNENTNIKPHLQLHILIFILAQVKTMAFKKSTSQTNVPTSKAQEANEELTLKSLHVV